ncbi:acyl-CoA desaturase [Pseudomethylobacillus aquaticus]|uniref:Acyl-CoA desaturase n=1 Tax=Pseudomethylobacillus aquaticus TaxID=2676064 RepID=A0A3N0V5S9_9PROT|nr:acyl-CoA desaturase [Pseudomethylobacillus aquaticus]ROH88025.1 acyl-CoA desaturase [Pseudomethylobacillus aquaticus]
MTAAARPLWSRLVRWFDSSTDPAADIDTPRIDWLRVIPFVLLHLACLSVIWVGWSAFAVLFAVLLYGIRMFAVTGFYHRYFSHKAFRTSRFMQFLFALLGATAVQRGPLWWASMHRHHHMHSDRVEDAHSPVQHGFLWSHLGWFLSDAYFATRTERVKELAAFPELRFLDRFDVLVPVLFALAIYGLGEWLAAAAPSLGTNGWQLLVWGFVISTVVLYHATFSVNSLAHGWGSRRYPTRDESRNNFLLAILTLGEGWHNNHHHYPGAARQGFYWWEIDLTYYGLQMLRAMGLIWDLRPVPSKIREYRKPDSSGAV